MKTVTLNNDPLFKKETCIRTPYEGRVVLLKDMYTLLIGEGRVRLFYDLVNIYKNINL